MDVFVEAVKPLVLSTWAKYASQGWLVSDRPDADRPEFFELEAM